MTASRGELTRVLGALRAGEGGAADELVGIAYGELRALADQQLARLPAGQTLQATALVHEAWMRLGLADAPFEDRAHFFGAAARAMRNVLVDAARSKGRVKRGGGMWNRVTLGEAASEEERAYEILALDAALARLETIDARQHEIVMLRYFSGLSIDETARALGVSDRTVDRDWRFARAWLAKEMRGGESTSE